ncbi:MAG: hypothetical protein E7388_00870 [Ruminococcaceae bacterium]|nr:hypothetical protein [Oscillospiraceae bacterium]
MIWWYNLTTNEQLLYIIASIASALLALELFFYLTGLRSERNKKKNNIFQLIFTLRSALILVSVASWSTIIGYKAIGRFIPAAIIGCLTALVILIIFVLYLRKVLKLSENSKISLENLIGYAGITYSSIPPKGEGRGKITVKFEDKMHVFEAIAYGDNKIPTGADIKIIDSLGSNLLLVEQIKEV